MASTSLPTYVPSPRDTLLYRRAARYYHKQQFYKCRVVYKHLLNECPRFEKGWISWAEAELDIGRKAGTSGFFEALQIFKEGMQKTEHNCNLQVSMALLYLQFGYKEEATTEVLDAIRKCPEKSELLNWAPLKRGA